KLAWHVLGAVLRTIRDRVPANLAAHLGAQLPLLVRGTYYDQWRPGETAKAWRSADEFLSIVSAELSSVQPIGADDAGPPVLRVEGHDDGAGNARRTGGVCGSEHHRGRHRE